MQGLFLIGWEGGEVAGRSGGAAAGCRGTPWRAAFGDGERG